ncbi:hypothetical protein BGU82_19950, partial [Clostridioides difficile]|uniref:hypothetical protein n=1 Tax=Clostridioides difficile TaxID=1496 RepID=UPI000BC8CABD
DVYNKQDKKSFLNKMMQQLSLLGKTMLVPIAVMPAAGILGFLLSLMLICLCRRIDSRISRRSPNPSTKNKSSLYHKPLKLKINQS